MLLNLRGVGRRTIRGSRQVDLARNGNHVRSHACIQVIIILTLILNSDFEVVQPLPNVSFPLGRSWAGNVPVDRPGHPNNTLFFWAFEKENGSLTAEGSTEPWGIWLNGG